MSSTSAQVLPNGQGADEDRLLRPRPRKPQHSQVSQLSADSGDGDALTPGSEVGTLDRYGQPHRYNPFKLVRETSTDFLAMRAVAGPRLYRKMLLHPLNLSPMPASKPEPNSAVSTAPNVASSRLSSSPLVSPTSTLRATTATSMASSTCSGSALRSWAAQLCCAT